jgi:hypothetical protein
MWEMQEWNARILPEPPANPGQGFPPTEID